MKEIEATEIENLTTNQLQQLLDQINYKISLYEWDALKLKSNIEEHNLMISKCHAPIIADTISLNELKSICHVFCDKRFQIEAKLSSQNSPEYSNFELECAGQLVLDFHNVHNLMGAAISSGSPDSLRKN